MESDDEEALAALLEEEADADVQEEEHLMVLAALAGLLASNEKPRRGGSAPGQMKAKSRHRLEGYCMLYSDYFADAPLHGDKVFRSRYRMSQKLFLRIVNSIREFDNYFKCKKNCTGKLGFTSIQKCTATMRMLAYEAPGDSPATGTTGRVILHNMIIVSEQEEPVFDTKPYYRQGPLCRSACSSQCNQKTNLMEETRQHIIRRHSSSRVTPSGLNMDRKWATI